MSLLLVLESSLGLTEDREVERKEKFYLGCDWNLFVKKRPSWLCDNVVTLLALMSWLNCSCSLLFLSSSFSISLMFCLVKIEKHLIILSIIFFLTWCCHVRHLMISGTGTVAPSVFDEPRMFFLITILYFLFYI